VDGSPIDRDRIDAIVERAMATHHVPGTGLVLFVGGAPVYARGYGKLAPTSVVAAASLTKAAFAYLVMTLVDTHVIDLDRPIPSYLTDPGERYRDVAGDPRWQRLTPRILLDHTSGFANFRRFEDDGVLRFHFDPGTRYAYSGEGLELLQLVVETATHTSLTDLMQARVFGPLGMTHTSMVWQPRFAADLATGFDEHGAALPPDRRDEPDAAGSMYTTLADYTRFLAAVMQGRGLSPASRAEMLAPQIRITSAHQFPTLDPETTTANDAIALSYGLGWGVYTTPLGRAFFKAGHDDGWRHYAVGFANGSGLLIMTNSSNGEAMYRELLEQILGNPYTPIEWERF
jgi:CubicO group peptidase (beta-lactamase class C family)